jgi:carboxymethylenebutenolidase
MSGSIVEFAANGLRTSGYLALPGTGKGPGLLVIQEWWGLVDHIKRVADRFAAAGFVALAPDLYHGKQARSPDDAGKLFMALNIAQAGKDLRGAAEYLLGLPAVTSKKVGSLGFCMGGQLALYAAQEHPDRIAAAVDFYGIHPNVPIDPARVRTPVQGHFGREDRSVKEADAQALFARLQAGGVTAECHFYEAGHAFFNDTRPEVYSAPSAALAWQRALAFLESHVR